VQGAQWFLADVLPHILHFAERLLATSLLFSVLRFWMSWRSFTPSLSTPGGTEVGLQLFGVDLAAKMAARSKLVLELVGAEGICFGVWGLGFRV